MKKSTAAAATSLLFGLGVNNAQAVDPQMTGSDTLGPIMDFMIGTAANPTSGYGFFGEGSMIEYSYQGSGNGEDAIENGDQELGPMSRFLTNNASSTGCNHATAVDSFAGCWQVAADSLAVYGNSSQACSTLSWGESVDLPSGGTYALNDWRSVLRIVYAGEAGDPTVPMAAPSAPIAQRCNSEVRQTLVNSWDNLFRGTCATGNCTNGLKHAFRRDDVSGTTTVFLELLNLPPIGTTPFCNGNETQDADPIRRACGGNGAVGIPGATGGETVCGVGATPNVRNADGTLGNGSLGVVLPTLLPPMPAGEDPNVWSPYAGNDSLEQTSCSALAFGNTGGGAFGRVAWTLQDVIRYGQLCPNGQPQSLGQCFWPKPPGQGGDAGANATGFGCIAAVNSRPPGSPSNFDARVYNLWARNANGSVKTYVRNNGATVAPQYSAYYRYRQYDCREEDETGSQACYASVDPCVIGFGGRSGIDEFGVLGLGLRSKSSPFVDSFPTAADADIYPLARPLYLCELRPTPADQDPNDPELHHQGTGGPVSDDFVAAQLEVRADLRANDPNGIIAGAAQAGGFFAVNNITKTCCAGNYNTATDACE